MDLMSTIYRFDFLLTAICIDLIFYILHYIYIYIYDVLSTALYIDLMSTMYGFDEHYV
jgi:hypothetical protein